MIILVTIRIKTNTLFTVNDLQRKAKEKENRNKIYFSIAKKCFDKIRNII